MKIFFAVLFVCLSITGCTRVTHLNGPTGEAALSLTCTQYIDRCYKAADQQCHHGYNILTGAAGYSGGAMGMSTFNLLITCK